MSIADKLTTIAENQQVVYDAGFSAGQAQGGGGSYDQGYEEGKQAEYDRFWDAFQQNGNRNNYTYTFFQWTKDMFSPKYSISGITNACFLHFNRNDPEWESYDLAEELEKRGLSLDTSTGTDISLMFMWASIGRIGTIDCTGATSALSNMFGYGKIRTIDKLIVKPENVFTNTFISNTELTNITFEGTIGDSISFQWQTKLSKASIESVINHLSTTTSGKTATFSKTAVTNAFGSTTASAWTSLVNTKSNWTISLV